MQTESEQGTPEVIMAEANQENMVVDNQPGKMITLAPSNFEETDTPLQINESATRLSGTISNMLEDIGGLDEAIPLPNVHSKVLVKILEWCDHYKSDSEMMKQCKDHFEKNKDVEDEENKSSDNINEWDKAFMQMEKKMIFELILAANYLDIPHLLCLGCKTVANLIKGKTPDEIREIFEIEDDLTTEEKDQIRKENEWCEETEE